MPPLSVNDPLRSRTTHAVASEAHATPPTVAPAIAASTVPVFTAPLPEGASAVHAALSQLGHVVGMPPRTPAPVKTLSGSVALVDGIRTTSIGLLPETGSA